MDTDDPDPRVAADDDRRWPMNVVQALLASPRLADELTRTLLFELVGAELREPLEPADPPTSAMRDFLGLVRHCERRQGGLAALAHAVTEIEGTSWTSHMVGTMVGRRLAQIPTVNGSATPDEPAQAGTAGTPVTAVSAMPAVPACPDDDPHRDFFVSYTGADARWASWISWQLEEAGYSVLVQEWDFVAGSNWQFGMDKGVTQCERTLAILSPAYLRSVYGRQEWQAAQGGDPTGLARSLVPVMVEWCMVPGLLGSVVHIDLTPPELTADEARDRLLGGIGGARTGRTKPSAPPPFPGPGQR